MAEGKPRQIVHIFKITRAKWTGGVAQMVRAPALQVCSPKLKPQSTKKGNGFHLGTYFWFVLNRKSATKGAKSGKCGA
jgi:hypothetical protein